VGFADSLTRENNVHPDRLADDCANKVDQGTRTSAPLPARAATLAGAPPTGGPVLIDGEALVALPGRDVPDIPAPVAHSHTNPDDRWYIVTRGRVTGVYKGWYVCVMHFSEDNVVTSWPL
jgi:hypothetical protein